MKKSTTERIATIAAGILLLGFGSANGQVSLEMRDPSTGNPFLSVLPGESFEIEFAVFGLSATQPLEAIDFRLDSLPTGLSRSTFLDELPSDWFGGTGLVDLTFSAANLNGLPLVGSWEFTTWTFAVALSVSPGTYLLTFIDQPSPQQQMIDPLFAQIPFTQGNFTVTVVPEPTAGLLTALTLGTLFLVRLMGNRSRKCTALRNLGQL